ncbi:DUF2637 domain-containing protein [Actinoplanes sp. NPDC048791]|uniref:DUF2637 domain-containing protein n=1 Tax=Actinoplanes sp. NPDC048791 TaxID=3154623 RepID=UPI00340BAF48
MTLTQLKRVRWGVRATLALGVVVSTIANVLHAVDNPISQAIAAWPPVALLLTVELISRIPVDTRALAFGRMLAAALIAGIAAWVSYWHMAGVAARYGETGASPYLLPVSVDGLIVVASICLMELATRIRTLAPEPVPAASSAVVAATVPVAEQPDGPADDADEPALPWQLAPAIPLSQFAAARRRWALANGNRPAIVHRADEPSAQLTTTAAPTPNKVSSAVPDGPDDADPVLSAARTVADELSAAGRRITRDALAAGVRARGLAISTERATVIARELSAAADGRPVAAASAA